MASGAAPNAAEHGPWGRWQNIMKTNKLLMLLLLCAGAVPALLADSATDRRIEKTAQSTYNFHVVLRDKVTATASDGVVTLTGTVDDDASKTLAEDTVNQIPDVTRVDDQITVAPSAPEQSDSWIAIKVHSALLFRANVSDADTKVTVNDGVVTLTGTADSDAQKDLTTEIVKEIKGVKSVNNNLIVEEPAAAHGGHSFGTSIDDASITAQVKYELLTHRSTSAIKTKVETRNGVVTITGEADSDAERDLVTLLTQNIRGVLSVNNQMTVKPGM